jgi:hypothetical protein
MTAHFFLKKMPQCCVSKKCLCLAAPLEGRHLCAISKE